MKLCLFQLTDHGPFSDLISLKSRPGHLSVFILYLISNSDPAPLVSAVHPRRACRCMSENCECAMCVLLLQFFYLVTEQYLQGKKDDLRKWAYEIYSTFLHEKAVSVPPSFEFRVLAADVIVLCDVLQPLRVAIPDDVVTNVTQTLEGRSEKDDVMRPLFQVARHQAQNLVNELLADFRNMRAAGQSNPPHQLFSCSSPRFCGAGLSHLYGERKLRNDHSDKNHESRAMEDVLWKDFERLV